MNLICQNAKGRRGQALLMDTAGTPKSYLRGRKREEEQLLLLLMGTTFSGADPV